jgi:hypothetical protein
MTVQTIDISLKEYIELMNNSSSSDFIYRGQTNSYNDNKFNEWKIVSTYNRNSQFNKTRFNSFLTQQLNDELFDIYYRNNEFVKNKKLENSDLLSKLYFFQHYGISTCLIDFTYNPFVGLYFAMSSLNSLGGIRKKDVNGFLIDYPENCFISIYEINYKLLVAKLKLSEVNNKIGYEYDQNFGYITNLNFIKKNVHIGIDINPTDKNYVNNNNLLKQEGAFILYDNHYNIDYGLIEFIKDYISENKIELDEPIVKIYKIKYNELYKPSKSKNPNFKTAFTILKEKEKTGSFLFDDYQGLKYDLIFFHDQ